MNSGGETARWDSEMLAQGTSGAPQSGFPLEAGPLPVVYQAGVDSVWASHKTPPRLDVDDGLAAWVPASLGEQKYLGIQVMSFTP